MIYVIGARPNGLVKLGHSDDPTRRVAQLQTGNSASLRLLARFDGGPDEEKWLHDFFRQKHTRGEWFDFTDSDAVEDVGHALTTGPLIIDLRGAERRRILSMKPDLMTGRHYSMMTNPALYAMACDRDMPRAELATLFLFIACSDENGVVVATAEHIADATGYARPVVSNAVSGLVGRGYVEKLRRSMYRVHPRVCIPQAREARSDTWLSSEDAQARLTGFAKPRENEHARGIA